jgi:hypothetical protein
MAIAADVLALGSDSEDGSDTTFALTLDAAVASGATILLAFQAGDVTVSSVTDDGAGGSLTWTQMKTEIGLRRIWLYRAHAPSGRASGVVITVTFATATTFKSGVASSFTGITGTSPEDVASTSWATTNLTNWISETITTVTANTIIVGVAETDGIGTPTNVATGGYTEANEIGIAAQVSLAMVYQIVSATGSYTPEGTWSASQTGATQTFITGALKEDAGGPPPPAPKIRVVQSTLRW